MHNIPKKVKKLIDDDEEIILIGTYDSNFFSTYNYQLGTSVYDSNGSSSFGYVDLNLKSKKYERLNNSGEKEIGFIAEDADSLGLKEIVFYHEGEIDSLNYPKMVIYCIEILKLQQEKINFLYEELKNGKANSPNFFK